MRRSQFRFTIGVVLFAFLGLAAAQPLAPGCGRTQVFFGNGVLTTEEGAAKSRMALQAAMGIRLSSEEKALLSFGVAYNPTAGWREDLLQSFLQSAQSDWVRAWRLHLLLDAWPTALKQEVLNILGGKLATAPPSDSADAHANIYKNYLDSEWRVMVVAHSQGNLFANVAEQKLEAALAPSKLKYFTQLGVAVPDSQVNKFLAEYVTLDHDLVIQLVTELRSQVSRATLPANTPSSPLADQYGADVTGHFFLESYLYPGSIADERVLDRAVASIRALPAVPLPTSIQVSTAPNPTRVGEVVAMTANVTSNCAPVGPKVDGGTVTWSVDLNPLVGCTAVPVGTDGQVRCLISFSTVGTHNIAAQYSGNTNFAPSDGSTTQTTTPGPPIPTIVAVTATPNPAQVGALVTMNASVTSASVAPAGPSPTGTVTWSADSTPLIGCSGTITPAGQASCAFSFSTVGAHNVTAEYSGDANFAPSIGSTTETIDGPFAFEVAESAVPLNPRLYCSHYEGEYQISGYYASFDRCRSDMSAVIRCVGSGCDSSRFAVSVSKSILGAGGGGACPSVQSDFGIDPVGSQSYVAGSYFWFPLGNDWTKAWPSISNISPVPNYQSAFVSFQWLNGDPGVCVPIGATLDLAFNVYDKKTGAYTVIPFFMSVP